jgi:hypothetical protein
MTPLRFLCFFLLLILLSCDDEEDNGFLSFPSLYKKAPVSVVGEIHVYDNNGIVTQPTLLSEVLQFDTTDMRYMRQSIVNYYMVDTLRFQTSKLAVLEDDFVFIECGFEMENDVMVLTTEVASKHCCIGEEVYSRKLEYQIVQHKPDIREEYIEGVSRGFFWFGYMGHDKYVFKRENNQLYAIVTQFIKRGPAGYQSTYLYNTLEPEFYRHLKDDEVISVIEFLVLYEKN